MLKKLRIKFVLVNMGIVTAMLLVIFGLVYRFTAEDLENRSSSALQTLTQSLQQPAAPGMPGTAAVQLPYFTLRISLRGEVTASGNTHFDLTDKEFLQDLIQIVYTAEESTGFIEKYELRYSRGTAMGQQLLAFVDVSWQSAALMSLVQTGVVVGAVSLVVFLGISILLAYWAVRPVERAWQQQRQFVSDASHELKTPLTVIMSNAELLAGEDCDEEGRARFAGSILTMSQHMRSLVEGLLELARADNGQIKKQFAPLDLSALVEEALLPFEAVLFERGLMLSARIEPGIGVTGSAQYLRQLVDILLDNAGKYSAPGVICVQLRRQGRAQCLLTVSNPGEPIAQEELEKIFDRFYRSDKARSRTGSFGLGLSIARSVVQEHGGRIWAQSNATGNCFFVQLPCSCVS